MNQIRKSKIRGIQAEYCQRAGLEPYGKTFELTVEMWMEMAAAFGLMVIDDEPEEDINGDWQQIETAPIDQKVLIVLEGCAIRIASKGTLRTGSIAWFTEEGKILILKPTHWMPLPELPDTKKAAS